MKRKTREFSKEDPKTTTVDIGTLYSANKTLVEKQIPDLTKEELKEKEHLIKEVILDTGAEYFMLLCHEQRDYTVFNITKEEDRAAAAASILINECICNRGNAKAIEVTNDGGAIEIWISIEGESFCYYFFPYDDAIIEV